MEHITTRDDAPRVRSVVSTGLIVVSVIFPVISGLALIFRSRSQRKERSSVTAEDVWFWVAWVRCSQPQSIKFGVCAAYKLWLDFEGLMSLDEHHRLGLCAFRHRLLQR